MKGVTLLYLPDAQGLHVSQTVRGYGRMGLPRLMPEPYVVSPLIDGDQHAAAGLLKALQLCGVTTLHGGAHQPP